MRSIVVGTAGHIDHGKTTLIRALTGIDTDRLEEEKRRGISIDLGFAHCKLGDDLRVAFIDVPGHERFIKNMLAGVGGIDAVLLVIAADESIKPQTREHFEICRLLRIPRGIVALTKIDVVDPDLVGLVQLETEEFVAGSFLSGAPVVPVSATTGQGLNDLRSALARIASEVTARDARRSFRMPVDRAFTMPGFGTIVTGTVLSGTVAVDAEVECHPAGERLRVRAIQVHGRSAKRASAGERAALNVTARDTEGIARGAVVAAPGAFTPAQTADCLIELLPSAKPLKDRAPVHFHTGTSETVAEVRTLDRSAAVNPGCTAAVRIILRDPVVLAPGDRFIIRMFSPVITIGGGEVVDPLPPPKITTGTAERARTLAAASLADRVSTFVKESAHGAALSDLVVRCGQPAPVILEALPPHILTAGDPAVLIDREWARATASRWRERLADFHRANPLLPGLPREELRSRELPHAPLPVFEAVLASDKSLVTTGGVVHLASHKIAFRLDEERALQSIESAFETAGLTVPAVADVLASSGVDPTRARSLLQILLRDKRLIRAGDDLVFHPSAIARLKVLLASCRGRRLSVPDFKELTGVSRKYAIPLLEYLDRERVTRRDGDARIVI